TNDYKKGRLRHWLKNRVSGNPTPLIANVLSLERSPSAASDGSTEGLLTWYDYEGKSSNSTEVEGKKTLPRYIAQRNPGGLWRITYTERNSLQKPTVQENTYSDVADTWHRVTYTYAANNIDLLSVSEASLLSSYGYNGFHQVLAATNALSEPTSYAYDSSHRLTNMVRANGLITAYTYDANGFLATAIDRSSSTSLRTNSYPWTNGFLYYQTDDRLLSVTNVWDALGRRTQQIYPDGTGITNVYDKLDLVARYDRMGFTNGYAYNGFRQLLRVTNANFNVTTNQYCDCGSLESVSDPLNNTTSFTYDNAGRRTRVTYPGGSYVDSQYDLFGQPIVVTDSAGVALTNCYTASGLAASASNSFGRVFYRVYDSHNLPVFSLDQNSKRLMNYYDALDRLIFRTNRVANDSSERSEERWDYSANVSGPTAHGMTDGNGLHWVDWTTYDYDLFDRITNEIHFVELGGAALQTNKFRFKVSGDLINLIDGKNQTNSWKYDEYGRTTNKTDAAGN